MRLREIIRENYLNDFRTDLDNYLIGAKGSGATVIDTSELIQQLQNMGYSVDNDSLMAELSNNPLITNMTPEKISMAPADETAGPDMDDSEDRVADMAQRGNSIGK